jgi:hypothetical protein
MASYHEPSGRSRSHLALDPGGHDERISRFEREDISLEIHLNLSFHHVPDLF